MRKLLLLTLFLVVSVASNATDYDKLWDDVKAAQYNDLPRQAMSALSTIIKTAEQEKEYGEFLAAQLCYARTEAEISADSLAPAIARLYSQLAKIEGRKQQDNNTIALCAVYNAVLAEIGRINSSINLPEGKGLTYNEYYDKALRNPDVLAAIKTDAYNRLVSTGSDDSIYNNDLLSLIGHSCGRYTFLKDYYLSHGNRRAACIELYYETRSITRRTDAKSISARREKLNKGIEEFGDIPEAALFADMYYDTMSDDEDISNATRYSYLKKAIDRWGDGQYGGTFKNSLEKLTQPTIFAEIDKDLTISLRNIYNVNIEFLPLKADGTMNNLSPQNKNDLKKLLNMVSGGSSATVSRKYNGKVWENISDTINVPELKNGVYLVKLTGDTLTAYDLYYRSDLALLNLSHNKDQHRLIVVSSKTGMPVSGATIVLSEENLYSNKVKNKKTVTCNNSGEAFFSTKEFTPNLVYIFTEKDKAFKKTHYNHFYSEYDIKQKQDIITVFTDRAIYRPGQELKGGIVVHNAYNPDSIYCVENKTVYVTVKDSENKKVFNDTITTDSFGNAGFEMTLPKDARNGNFTITCTAKGTITGNAMVRVEEYKRPTFRIVEPEELRYKTFHDKDSVNVTFHAETMTQLPVQDAMVVYSVTRDNVWFWRSGSSRTIIASNDTLSTDKAGNVNIPLNIILPEEGDGRFVYKIHVKITDNSGETHESSIDIEATRGEERKPVHTYTEQEFSISESYFPNDNEAVVFKIKPNKEYRKRAQPLYVAYSLISGGKAIECSSFTLTDSIYTRKFNYKKEYGEGLTLNYIWMLDGKVHRYTTTVKKPRPQLKLKTSWTTFRDKTTPGANESWTLKVEYPSSLKNVSGCPESALTATIYDSSLDMLRELYWSVPVVRNSYSQNMSWQYSLIPGSALSAASKLKYNYYHSLSYASFKNDLFPRLYYRVFAEPMMVMEEAAAGDGMKRVKIRGAAAGKASPEAMAMSKNEVAYDMASAEASAEEETADLSAMVRTNLGETAFFTPSLVSDQNGNINISFTMPETMTTWKFKGFVHDRKMRNDLVDATCVAKKDIIVKPNVPRFLRENDKTTFAATISNTTDKEVNATAIMQLLLPGTNNVVWEQKQPVRIGANETTSVSIASPKINNNLSADFANALSNCSDSLLTYRIVATTEDGASDGEQHIIPVLPQKEFVVSTIAFTQHGPGTYTRDLSDILYEGSEGRKLTLQYVEHAIQMILDVIPSAVSPDHNDALSLASATYVMNTFNIADTAKVVDRLRKLQNADGSWSWWEGMKGSVYMTTSISKLLARLNYHGFNTDVTDKMVNKAIPYMMKYLRKEADELRKFQKKNPKAIIHPSETSTEIMYICALMKQNYKKDKDIKYLVDLLAKVPNEFTIYGKAQSATIFAMYDRPKLAAQFLQSLKEYTVYTEEAGRYYDSPKAYYSWRNYRIPTEVAAMEAIRFVTPQDTTTLEEMQRWLLHEKRTQKWDTSVNTTDAIYAFCLDNTELKEYKNDLAANHGNIEQNIKAETIEIPEDKVFKYTKKTNGTSWGGLFLEQYADISSIKTQGSGFSIKREIIGEDKLEVGKRIKVRITIKADRDYDFVTVTDNRPACLEPVNQTSGYESAANYGTAFGSYAGYYREMKDNKTNYYFNQLSKGTHVINTEYYVDRQGTYQFGTCSVKCTYAPEFSAIYSNQGELKITK